MADQMYELRRSEFPTVSVTDNSISIENVSVNLKSENSWSFKFGSNSDKWSVLSSESNDTCFKQVLTARRQKADTDAYKL